MNTITLNNDVKIPQLGYGVYKVKDSETYHAVTHAINAGYRSIDTAQFYQNEKEVGKAISESGIPREDFFITTKVWNSHQGHHKTMQAFNESLEKLKVEYLDLYLIHWPVPSLDKYIETYQTLESLYKEGRVKAIGVSNFHIEHLERLMEYCEVKPVLNQVECHPYLPQKELKTFCKEHNIYIECWSPLYRGGTILEEPIIASIAKKHGKTPAQIILRWHIQEQSIVIPKSITPSRIKENIDIFDFTLSEKEMNDIYTLETGTRIGADPNDMNKIDL